MSAPARIGFVYCNDHLAGTITEYSVLAGYEYEFRYDTKYLKSGLAKIGTNLPLTELPLHRNHLPAFFTNLMSEGWVKRHQAKLARLDVDDKFGLLLAHGEELIGPIKVLPRLLKDEDAAHIAELPKKNLKGFTIDFARHEFNEVAMRSLGRASISGVQPKMFLTHKPGTRKTLTASIGMGPYIVKPSPRDLPHLAINEFIIMRLCQLTGFNVADHALVPFSCGELAYVTGRFDLDTAGRNIGFIEDLASVMDVAPGNKSSEALSYEHALKVAHASCGYHAQILKDGFLHVLMAYLVGNNDLHMKNMSLVRPLDSDTATGFSKIYDMVSVAPYKEYDGSELSIWLMESEVRDAESTSSYKNYGYYTKHDFVAFAAQLGLNQKVAKKLIHYLVKKVSQNLNKAFNSVTGFDELKHVVLNRIQARLETMSRPWL
ncbi:type II toxin-antitoxin system HipA family toxin [Rheinheimera sp. UJ63]|uniref:type II toxin-antitoxin system HipA family toxin n=1 Tax=Rheinheimera sp. UJ63 TaxID=2910157 RepID=UPI001F446011|nr:type II toxin-antitoxin system HipA family toxin [Rheinheimera sp. UJ63]MCF4010612.1 type II toxin-antitoxin system HipA family toxin [Rheinheimera sp. UJ63]